MKTISRKHKKCRKYQEFSDRWVYCEVCKFMICVRCAGSEYLCKDHYVTERGKAFIELYFKEKYTNEV